MTSLGPMHSRPCALRRFVEDRRGAIAVLSAFLLPLMIAMVGLVYEFGQGLLTKAENQRVADAAAYAGALAYNATSSTTTMQKAAQSVGLLNGIPAASLTATLGTSPSGDGNQSVDVSIATTDMLVLAPVLRVTTHSEVTNKLSVSSSSYAELTSQASTTGCIIALKSSGTGVTLSGGTTVTANSCAVASNNTVTVPCGTYLTAPKVTYDSTAAPSVGCSGIKPPAGTPSVQIIKQATADPLSGNTEISTSTSALTAVGKMTNPTASGTAITFAYAKITGLPAGCTTSQTSSPFTVICTTGGTYNFGEITLSGGVTVTFENTGTSINTYNIGAGSCSGGSYSICDTGTALTFLGPSNFVLPGGIYIGGGSSVTLASRTTSNAAVNNDSFQIGASSGTSGSYAINVSGGSTLIFGNAEGASDVFTVNGNIITGGGSCLWLPAAAQHNINGYLAPAGGVSLANDSTENNVYTISGYAWFGANGGGNVTCGGVTFGVQGVNVTMVLGGASVPTSGTCGNSAFCVAGGYGNVTLTAPTTGATANLAVVGPTAAGVTAGAYFTEGSSGSNISGAFYFPNGPITLDGAGSVSSTGCLELIGTQITLSGGSNTASACSGLSASSTASVTLVQ